VRIRQAVACQAAPTTLKAAFLDPVEAGSMATEVALELFAKADADFLSMFTGEGSAAGGVGRCSAWQEVLERLYARRTGRCSVWGQAVLVYCSVAVICYFIRLSVCKTYASRAG
jgi:hypothetical protein